MAPVGAVVTHKVIIINHYSFDVDAAGGEKGGLNRDANRRLAEMLLC